MARALILLLGLAVAGCGAAPERPATAPETPSGTIVYVSERNRLNALDVATGRRVSRRIAAVAECGPQMYVIGGRIVFAGYRGGRTTVYSIPMALDRRPTRLGSAHAFVPSTRDGRVWLLGTSCTRRHMTGVREVTVDSEVTMASDRRVPGEWVAGAVDGGIVVHRERALVVWDPATGRTLRPLDLDVIGEARGGLIAGCAPGCDELALLDAVTGRRVPLRKDPGYRLYPAAKFSPDGALVATTVVTDRRWRVALVDARDRSHTLVPGRWRTTYPEIGWTASGWLLIRNGRVVSAYRPGAGRPIELPFRLPKSVPTFVTG
jgi:hypothetical protein